MKIPAYKPLSNADIAKLAALLFLLTGAIGLTLYLIFAAPGWRSDKQGTYYITSSHTRAVGMFSLSGKTYLFDQDGYLLKGFREYEGNTYYLDEDGVLVKGFIRIDGICYSFDEDTGAMIRGFYELVGADDGETYYFDENGERYLGFLNVEGATYYFDRTGRMAKGIVTVNGRRYYFDEDGMLQTGRILLGEQTYYFGEDGAMLTGFQAIEGKLYYFDPASGQMHRGFLDMDGDRVLFGDNGIRGKGFTEYNGRTYYTDAYGHIQTGLLEIDGYTYHFDHEGRMSTEWTIFSEGSRYFDEGRMLIGWHAIGDAVYYFHKDGIMAVGDTEISGHLFRFTRTGHFESGWIKDDLIMRYHDDFGFPVSGITLVGNYLYCFSDSGVMMTNLWAEHTVYAEGSDEPLVGQVYFGSDGTAKIGHWRDEDGTRYYFDENHFVYTGFMDLDGFTYYFDGRAGHLTGTHIIDGVEYVFAANGILASQLD